MIQASKIDLKLDPHVLLDKLSAFGNEYQAIPFQKFKGIYNKTPNGKKGHYCYLISFFQLFFHIQDVIDYLQNPNLENTSEILLSNIANKLMSNRTDSAITISKFISNWKGWYTKTGQLKNENDDIDQFCQYLLNSVTQNLQNMFLIKYQEQSDHPPNTPYYNSFYMKLILNGNSIQKLVSNHIAEHPVTNLPKFLFLFTVRTNGITFLDDEIQVNSFISINNVYYKFCGTSIFNGHLFTDGHYYTFIKFYEKYVVFDDEKVYNLFFYPNCEPKIYAKMKSYNEKLKKKCSFILYEKYDDAVTPDMLSQTEIIFTQEEESKFINFYPHIQTWYLNYKYKSNLQRNLFINTMNLIKKANNTQQLYNIVLSHNNSPNNNNLVSSSANSSQITASSPPVKSQKRKRSEAANSNSSDLSNSGATSANSSQITASSPPVKSQKRKRSEAANSNSSDLSNSGATSANSSQITASSPPVKSQKRKRSEAANSNSSDLSNSGATSANSSQITASSPPVKSQKRKRSEAANSNSSDLSNSGATSANSSQITASSPPVKSQKRKRSEAASSNSSDLSNSGATSANSSQITASSPPVKSQKRKRSEAASSNSSDLSNSGATSANSSQITASSPPVKSQKRKRSEAASSNSSDLSNSGATSANSSQITASSPPVKSQKRKRSEAANSNSSDLSNSGATSANSSQITASSPPVKSQKRKRSEAANSNSSNHSNDNTSTIQISQEIATSIPEANRETVRIGQGSYVSKQTLAFGIQSSESDDSQYFNQIHFNSNNSMEFLNMNDHCDSSYFFPSLESSDNEKNDIKEDRHLFLPKEETIIDEKFCDNLYGKLYFNNDCIPLNNDKRNIDSKYVKYRKLFKIVGRILRKLNFSDQGQTNSEILMDKLQIDKTSNEEIQKQGNILYKSIKVLLKKDDVEYDSVERELKPILDWYQERYHLNPKQREIDETVIDESITHQMTVVDEIGPKDIVFIDNNDYKSIFETIFENEKNSDFDEEFIKKDKEEEEEEEEEYFEFIDASTDDEPAIIPNEEEEDIDTEEDMINQEIYPFVEEHNKDQRNDNQEHDNTELENHDQKYRSYMKGAISTYINELYENALWKKDNGECDRFKDDDNQMIAECYFWQERAELFNVEEILEEIKSCLLREKSTLENFHVTASQAKKMIECDFYKLFFNHPEYHYHVARFVRQYLDTVNSSNAPALVKAYKKHKNIPDDKFWLTAKTLRNKLHAFKKLTEEKQGEIIQRDYKISDHGGFREENIKVTEETIKCMIALVLDFPTLSSSAIASYINSPFGPNFKRKINPRTIQRYLKNLKFTVNKASFAPPNRNSIGLRIFRVAWCRLIQKITKDDNVLIGYIDEAAVTTNEGRKYGRSFIGITPVVNSPLSKLKVSVLSLVLPGFGVLYRFINTAANSFIYAAFLRDCVKFIRKYICNSKTEIVLIEDNCPIHCTLDVENVVNDLKIALIPIVPYSPSLNGVVEGLFGYIKSSNIQIIDANDTNKIRNEIKSNWRNLVNQNFNLDIAHSLYHEWILRLQACCEGKPIYSGHIESNEEDEFNFDRLQNITVNRMLQKRH